jgi:hypothetical protein
LMGHSVGIPASELSTTIRSLMRRKSPHWQYEGEWRQLHRLSECRSEQGDNSNVNYFKPLEAKAIAEVIFGCRCGEVEGQIKALLERDSAFQHVRVRHAIMHDDEFKLVVR